MAHLSPNRLCMNFFPVFAKDVRSLDILFPHAIKKPVQNIKTSLMMLLPTLAIPVHLHRLQLLRSNNHLVQSFLQIPQLILCSLKLSQLVKRGLHLLVVKGPKLLRQSILVPSNLLPQKLYTSLKKVMLLMWSLPRGSI